MPQIFILWKSVEKLVVIIFLLSLNTDVLSLKIFIVTKPVNMESIDEQTLGFVVLELGYLFKCNAENLKIGSKILKNVDV